MSFENTEYGRQQRSRGSRSRCGGGCGGCGNGSNNNSSGPTVQSSTQSYKIQPANIDLVGGSSGGIDITVHQFAGGRVGLIQFGQFRGTMNKTVSALNMDINIRNGPCRSLGTLVMMSRNNRPSTGFLKIGGTNGARLYNASTYMGDSTNRWCDDPCDGAFTNGTEIAVQGSSIAWINPS